MFSWSKNVDTPFYHTFLFLQTFFWKIPVKVYNNIVLAFANLRQDSRPRGVEHPKLLFIYHKIVFKCFYRIIKLDREKFAIDILPAIHICIVHLIGWSTIRQILILKGPHLEPDCINQSLKPGFTSIHSKSSFTFNNNFQP
jgi:hypothetical protein